MLKRLQLAGFKAFIDSQSVGIKPLTLLSGANSSGKSTLIQPLLLMKQTIECPYDPGALLLDGPNIRVTAADQVLAGRPGKKTASFGLEIELDDFPAINLDFKRGKGDGFKLGTQIYNFNGSTARLTRGDVLTPNDALMHTLGEHPGPNSYLIKMFQKIERDSKKGDVDTVFEVNQERCFLNLKYGYRDPDGVIHVGAASVDLADHLVKFLRGLIHIPGLRGNPERDYRATTVGNDFPATFENYVASIIWKWENDATKKIASLGEALSALGLTTRVKPRKILDTRVEIKVARIPAKGRKGAPDLVNIADVGLGVAQVLPILVALQAAESGQTIYIEQPELHLHPLAQWRLMEQIAIAVKNRGVQVIIETHSSIMLRSIQLLVAKGEMPSELVGLNWFTRDSRTGATKVSSANLDSAGAYGEWPVDFDDVSLDVERQYMDAVTKSKKHERNG